MEVEMSWERLWEGIINAPLELRLLVAVIVTILIALIYYQGWLYKKLEEQVSNDPDPDDCPGDSSNSLNPFLGSSPEKY